MGQIGQNVGQPPLEGGVRMLMMQQDSMHKERINVVGIGKVIKCDGAVNTKTGKVMWRCFINFDYEYKKDKQIKERCMNLVAFEPLAKFLTVWSRSDVLMIMGSVQKNTYNGRDYYQIVTGFVHDLHDYSTMASSGSDGGDDAGDDGGYTSSDFDPGF